MIKIEMNSMQFETILFSQFQFQEFSDHKHRKIAEKSSLYRPNSIDVQDEGHTTAHITKYNRFEQLLKNLVGRKVSREPASIATSLSTSSIIGSNGVNRATLDKEYPQGMTSLN